MLGTKKSTNVGKFADRLEVELGAWRLLKKYEAHVTAICSGKNAETVRSAGAHEVIDYTSKVSGQWPGTMLLLYCSTGRFSSQFATSIPSTSYTPIVSDCSC